MRRSVTDLRFTPVASSTSSVTFAESPVRAAVTLPSATYGRLKSPVSVTDDTSIRFTSRKS